MDGAFDYLEDLILKKESMRKEQSQQVSSIVISAVKDQDPNALRRLKTALLDDQDDISLGDFLDALEEELKDS